MTRAELEQMKRLVIDLIDAVPDRNAGGFFDRTEAALAVLDAELAKPEAREWRVVVDYGMPNRPRNFPYKTEQQARSFAQWVGNDQPHRIESRTPAGPWEAVESICSVLAAALVISPVLAVCIWGGN